MLRSKRSTILKIVRNFLYVLVLILFFMLFIYKMKQIRQDELVTQVSESAIKYIDFTAQDLKPLQLSAVKLIITKYNSEERIANMDFFGPLKPGAPVFVIFVDKYKVNVKYLLVSLTQVLGIEDALIIFSHSCFDENVNRLIKTVDFARVLQIFYPYSLQLHPHEFPGFKQGDCPRDMDISTAQSINCTGAESPDIHGRYRDPSQAQRKHYWWWTMNKVFENLSHTKNHKGMFTFLEDDVYLTEDFIYMVSQMKEISSFITNCEFISLESTKFKFSNLDIKTYAVEISTWDPNQHSSVLSFDSSVWSSIAAHYYLFCYIDDYSWSRSLYYLSLNRKDGGRFKVMFSTMPRVFKTSSTALYDNILKYDMMYTISKILEIQKRYKIHLYPSHLEVYYNIELDDDDFIIFDYVDNNGGWSDPRDKKMCINITTNKIKRLIMDMDQEFHEYEFIRP